MVVATITIFKKGIAASRRERLIGSERWGLRRVGDLDAVVNELVVCSQWAPADITRCCGGVTETCGWRGRTKKGVDDVLFHTFMVDDEGED